MASIRYVSKDASTDLRLEITMDYSFRMHDLQSHKYIKYNLLAFFLAHCYSVNVFLEISQRKVLHCKKESIAILGITVKFSEDCTVAMLCNRVSLTASRIPECLAYLELREARHCRHFI